VRSSSAPVRRLNPTISTARIAASFRVSRSEAFAPRLLQVDLIYRLAHQRRPLFVREAATRRLGFDLGRARPMAPSGTFFEAPLKRAPLNEGVSTPKRGGLESSCLGRVGKAPIPSSGPKPAGGENLILPGRSEIYLQNSESTVYNNVPGRSGRAQKRGALRRRENATEGRRSTHFAQAMR
jgi:hypothetical protein